ncbi:MAG: hypothetical protein ACLP4R_23850 [Solirubrobacteraceae bacterium]
MRNSFVAVPAISITPSLAAISRRATEACVSAKQGSGTRRKRSLVIAKGAHLRAVDRPGAATDAAAAVLSVAADTAMCLLAARFAVTCKRTWLSLAWRSSRSLDAGGAAG